MCAVPAVPAVPAAAAAAVAAAACPTSAHCLYLVLHSEHVFVVWSSECIFLSGAARFGFWQTAVGHLKHPLILGMVHLHGVIVWHAAASCAAKIQSCALL